MLGFIISLLICYIIYRIATAKKRMAQKIYNYILHLHASGHSNGVLNDVLYDNAYEYAVAHGARPDQEDMYKGQVQMTIRINNNYYYVFFSRMPNGTTYLGLTDADKAREEFRKRIYGKTNDSAHTSCTNQTHEKDIELKNLLNEFYKTTQDDETVKLMTRVASGLPISALDLGKVKRQDEIVKRIANIKNISVKDLFEKNILDNLLNEYIPEYAKYHSDNRSSLDLESTLKGFLDYMHENRCYYSRIFEGYLYDSVLIGNLNKDIVRNFLINEVLLPIDLRDNKSIILDKYVTQIYEELKKISDGIQDVMNAHEEFMRFSSQQKAHKKNYNSRFNNHVPF